MPDAATVAVRDDSNFASADRLSLEVAILAGRLARLLAHSPVAQDGHVASGNAFLSAMFDAAAAGRSASELEGRAVDRKPHDRTDPIDRLADALSLDAREVDLIVLAAMAEEHEGYASILRGLNPQTEPCATVGLAAQLECRNTHDRIALRRMLEMGAAITSGVLALRGEVPFFEKSLILADGLWSVLCGLDVLPPSIKPITLSANSSGLARWLEAPDVAKARTALKRDEPILLMIFADSESIAAHRAAALTAASSRSWIAVECIANQSTTTERLILIHALARGDVPIFKLSTPESSSPAPIPDTRDFPGVAIVCARRGTPVPADVGRPLLTLTVDSLSAAARQNLWRETLPELAEHASTLAARYIIEPSAAAEVATDLRAQHSL